MMIKNLYLGVGGRVVCIDQKTGDTLWQTKLKSSQITNIFIEDDAVFAHAGGLLFCLHIGTGDVMWHNELKGLGFGVCIMASENQNSAVTAQVAALQAQVNTMAATGNSGS
jgi:outer membrane protein assembly factor BamB